MAKQDADKLVAGLNMGSGILNKLIDASVMIGGTAEDIHRLTKPEGDRIIEQMARLIVPVGSNARGMENFPLAELELGVRAYNCLMRVGIEIIGDLLEKSEDELMSIPNFGKKPLEEVKEVLAQHGLALRGSTVPSLLDKSIAELELSTRAYNCLGYVRIETIADLVAMSESELLGSVPNFGKVSLEEVKEKLGRHGLALRDSSSPQSESEAKELEDTGLIAKLFELNKLVNRKVELVLGLSRIEALLQTDTETLAKDRRGCSPGHPAITASESRVVQSAELRNEHQQEYDGIAARIQQLELELQQVPGLTVIDLRDPGHYSA